MRTFAFFLILFFPIGFLAAAENAEIRVLLDMVGKNNPGIKKAKIRMLAAESAAKAAGSLPDPKLVYTDFYSPVETKNGPQERILSFSQIIPFPGKLSLGEKIKIYEYMTARSDLEIARRNAFFRAESLYYDLYLIRKSLEIREEEKETIEAMIQSAGAEYEAGRKPLSDILKLGVSRDEREREINDLAEREKSVLAGIRELAGGSETPEFSFPRNLDADIPPGEPERLLSFLRNSPFLKRREYMEKKAAAAKSLAAKTYLPDFNIGFSRIYIGGSGSPNGGEDAGAFFAGMNIPLWFGKKRAEKDAAARSADAAGQAYESAVNALERRVRTLFYGMMSAAKNAFLYRTRIIPAARETLSASSADYETGKVGISEWLEGEKMLARAKISYHGYTVSFNKLKAEMRAILGNAVWRNHEEKE